MIPYGRLGVRKTPIGGVISQKPPPPASRDTLKKPHFLISREYRARPYGRSERPNAHSPQIGLSGRATAEDCSGASPTELMVPAITTWSAAPRRVRRAIWPQRSALRAAIKERKTPFENAPRADGAPSGADHVNDRAEQSRRGGGAVTEND